MKSKRNRGEALLTGFKPDFEFHPVDPLPTEEFQDRVRRLRREAVTLDLDALIVHADPAGWFHTSNPFLRYLCDWTREGCLIVPSDADETTALLSFFSPETLYPAPGEPAWVQDVRQVGIWGREKYARPGDAMSKVCEAVRGVLTEELGLEKGRVGLIGDRTSLRYWGFLAELMPSASFSDQTELILRMQRIRSVREQALIRAAAQLIDIGVQAAHHVMRVGVTDYELYAAFTYAQLAHGGETGDGYQIAMNEYGTHIGKPYGRVAKRGDIVNMYLSRVTYRGYDAQAARMMVAGSMTVEQERLFKTCVEAVERAMAIARPGVRFGDISDAAFAVFVESGYLKDGDARAMQYAMGANGEGKPSRIRHVVDAASEASGRAMRHVYPPLRGPIAPSIGHSVSMAGIRGYTVLSTNDDRVEPGMTFVIHAQWLDPLVAGCNVGNCLLATEDGVENLNIHTTLAPFRAMI